MDWILDRLLPSYDFRSRYTRHIAAPPRQVWQAMHELTAEELPITRLLMGIRSAGRSRPTGRLVERIALPALARDPDREAVNGAVARYWRFKPRQAPPWTASPEGFRDFAEPGWAKAAMSMQLVAVPGGTRLAAETRIRATDAASRRRFAAYWLLIAAGGGLIRLEWLRAIARRAERSARDPDRSEHGVQPSDQVVVARREPRGP
jgi:hypothetical protein